MLNRQDICRFAAGHEGPRIALFSFWNEKYKPLAEIAAPNWKAYCERHGYALRVYPGEFHLDGSHLESYGDKGRFRLYYDLRGHADIIMHLDIDSLFMNHDIRVEQRLGADRFLWTYDDNGPLSSLWIAKTDEETQRHLRYAYKLAATESNARNGIVEPNGISDQDAMTRIMHIPPFSSTFANCSSAKAVGHCFPQTYEDGDWIFTVPGLPLGEKIETLKRYAEKAG